MCVRSLCISRLMVVTGSTRAVPLRIAGLNDEVVNHPVEYEAIIETALGQLDEVGRTDGSFVLVELELDPALAGLQDRDAVGAR